jgi:hypothetical protein
MHPPDPEMRRGGPPQATPEVAKSSSGKQKLNGLISAETQAALFVLLPIVVTNLLLAIAGARQ